MHKDHSTQPDKITGWHQRGLTIKQFPIVFVNPQADRLSKELTSFGSTCSHRVIYMGPRHVSNIRAYKSYCKSDTSLHAPESCVYGIKQMQKYDFTYRHQRQKVFSIRIDEYRLFKGMNPTFNKQDLKFDSDFECGNLDLAISVSPTEYDLLMRVDSNTKGHAAWFYFKVCNASPKQKVKFNIINHGKKRLLYKEGMKPYTFRKAEGKWAQSGLAVTYTRKHFRYAGAENVVSQNLSFTYEFVDSEDVYFAYCVPYSYSYLLHRIKELKDKNPHLLQVNYSNESTGGLPIPLLTISNFSTSQHKSKVLCIARLHPGETQGSWMIDGFISYLLSPQSYYLREKNVFIIVPMVNVDGVVLGNFRTGISGRDLNRVFNTEDCFKEIDLLRSVAFYQRPQHFIDFHGHSAKRNVFVYGPDYTIQDRNYLACRTFPKLISKACPAFRYYSCLFKVSNWKVTTGRAVMLREFKVDFSYTVEASTHCFGPLKQSTLFNSSQFWAVGHKIGEAFDSFIRFLRILPKKQMINQDNRPSLATQETAQKSEKTEPTHELLHSIAEIAEISVTDKQMLREILLQEKEAETHSLQPDSEQFSDSDCEDESNDYSSAELQIIVSSKLHSQKIVKNAEGCKKKKQSTKAREDSISKQAIINQKHVLERSRESTKLSKKIQPIKNSELKHSQEIKFEQQSKLPFKEPSMIIQRKRIESTFSNDRLSSPNCMLAQDRQLMQLAEDRQPMQLGWNFRIPRSPSSKHFIFEEPTVPVPVKKKQQPKTKSSDCRKNLMLSIRRPLLPSIEKSYSAFEHSGDRSMLSEILEEYERKNRAYRNVRIMFL